MRALVAQQARQAAGVDASDGNDLVGFQILAEVLLRAEVARRARHFAQHQTGDMDRAGFRVFGVHTDVADVRIGQRDALLTVRGVGEDFLITGHGGVEHHFADRLARSPNRNAFEYRTVGKDKQGRRRVSHSASNPLFHWVRT